MKIIKYYWLIAFLILTIFIISGFGFCFYNLRLTINTARKLVIDILDNKPENFDKNFNRCQKQLFKFQQLIKIANPIIFLIPKRYQSPINQYINNFNQLVAINNFLPELVGKNGRRVYYVLLQNNLELRPSGGFIGSYAKMKFNDGGMEDILIQDIYVPDGQIVGHVDPPWPIQAAFKQGWWRLRDSNWEIDFPQSSKTILWFFEKGKEDKGDGIVAVNLMIIKDLIKLFEPITLADYEYKITAENLYQITQNEAEKDFFPGSTQKKDFLSSLGRQLFLNLKTINNNQLIQLIKLINQRLGEKQILISFNHKELSAFFQKLNWDGSVNRQYLDNQNNITDYFYLVDTNLGANKANCCIERNVLQEIKINDEGAILEKVMINYINSHPKQDPKPPLFWGGNYHNFLRLIIPKEAEAIMVKVNNQLIDKRQLELEINEQKKIQTIGFFITVPAISQTLVEIDYQKIVKLKDGLSNFYLEIQKEPGIDNYLHKVKINLPTSLQIQTNQITNNFTFDKIIKTDEVITLTLNKLF